MNLRILFLCLAAHITTFSFAQYKGQLSGNTETLWKIHKAPDGAKYIAGNGGIILRQDTGCTGWDQLNTGATNGVRSIWFTNDSVGYTCGTSGTLSKTENRGNTWATLTSGTTIGLLDIEFINDTVGYTAGGGSEGFRILRTYDAGVTWTTIDSTLTHSPFDVTFIDQNTGYLAGVGGMIMKTIDGGLNWIVLVAGVTGNTTWTSIYFTDSQTGYVVGQNGTINKTIDGGTTWTTLSSGSTQFLNGVYFQNDSTGFVTGNSGTLLKTTNRGLSFQTIGFTHQSSFRGIYADENQTLICGSDGLVFEYDTTITYESVWSENFCNVNDSISMGNDWTIITSGTSTKESWRFDNPNPFNGLNFSLNPPFASFDAQFIGSSDKDSCILESPEFDVSDFTQLSLQWNEAFLPNFQGQVFSTIQGWDGTQWVTLYNSNGGFNSNSSGSVTYTASYSNTAAFRKAIDISSLAGERDAKLRFIYHDLNPTSRFWWAIDDIEIRAGKIDLKLDSIILPAGNCTSFVGDTVKIKVSNSGDFGVFPIQVAYQLDTRNTEYKYFVASLAAGADTILKFSNPLPSTLVTSPNLKVWLRNTFDADVTNDTLQMLLQGNSIAVNLGKDTALCAGESLTLKADIANADAYQWTGSTSTADSLIVITSGLYKVEVTKNGCTISDSVQVTFNPLPTGTITASAITASISDSVVFNITTTANIIQWNFGANATPATAIGAGPHTVRFTKAGSTLVKVTLSENSCADSTDFALTLTPEVGLSENMLQQIQLYPNPGHGKYTLEIPPGLQLTSAYVLNMNGALVKHLHLASHGVNEFTLDASIGIYILRLNSEHANYNLRLIKN